MPQCAGTNPGIYIPDADPLTTTNPWSQDSDSDGLTDDQEDLNLNGLQDVGETDPADFDSDDDNLTDGQEIFSTLTDPLNADTDGGGAQDGFEYQNGFDPNNPIDDDNDFDYLTNIDEGILGTDPNDPDTDDDWLLMETR
ncbi:MAG: hypothetical protein IPG07_14580 [Crocinitomicaceae bacterium]|nr:hypothetical protein [Crocinitomicaceae bacterium]